MEVTVQTSQGRSGQATVRGVDDALAWVDPIDPQGPLAGLAMGNPVHLRYSDVFGSLGADARVLPSDPDPERGALALRIETDFVRVQRRTYQRVTLRRTVRWLRATDAPIDATTRDLSARGLRFSTNEDLTVGEVIVVELFLDRVTTVRASAQVCHVSEAVAAPGAWLIGAAFLDLPDLDQDRILAHLGAVLSGAVRA